MNSDWLHRLAVLVVGLICVVGNAQAGSVDVFYKAEAKIGPTGGGRVYVSEQSTNTPNYKSETVVVAGKAQGAKPFFSPTVAGPEKSYHYYAIANEGYQFVGWKKNGTANSYSSYDYNSRHFETDKIEITSNNENKPTSVSYTAYFKVMNGAVKAYPAQPERGDVTLNNDDNQIGDEVILNAAANTSLGVVFLGWNKNKNDHENFISTDNPYSFTVTSENMGTYYAHFSEPASTVYCILKNHDTGKYLSLYGDGVVSDHTTNITILNNTYNNVKDGCVFSNSLKTISENDIVNNPLIVFKRKTTGVGGEEIGSLLTDLKTLNGTVQGTISVNSLMGVQALYFSLQNNGCYRIYTPFTTDLKVDKKFVEVESYLRDDGSEFVSMQSIAGKNNVSGVDWEVYFLTEEQVDHAFGVTANARFESGGKYYTSLCVPFAYELLDGVNAYYLNPDEDNYNEKTNTLTLTQIASGNVVPENMAVIIECNSANDPSGNRLLPVDEYTLSNVQKTEYAKNLLRGYNQIECRESNSYNAKYQAVANDHDYMYVFSMKNNNLGFYHLNENDKTIPKNKAYLHLHVTFEDISEELNQKANNVKLAFGSQFDDDLLNSINWSNEEADDIDLPIFNLQGVQVKNPEKGIYIRGGKKYLVK